MAAVEYDLCLFFIPKCVAMMVVMFFHCHCRLTQERSVPTVSRKMGSRLIRSSRKENPEAIRSCVLTDGISSFHVGFVSLEGLCFQQVVLATTVQV